MTSFAHRRARLKALPMSLIICLALLGAPATATAQHRASAKSIAFIARTQPRALMQANHAVNAADRALVARAKQLKRCLAAHQAHQRRCAASRRALQRAGMKLSRAERHLSRFARRATAGGHQAAITWQSPRIAPVLNVSGQTLSWSRVAGLNTYVLVRRVPSLPDQYSIVNGTSTVPPPVPGVSVSYTVRTTAWWSAWAASKSIAYPGPSADDQAAPSLSVSGQTLNWNQVAGVNTYVLVRKVPGQSDIYSEVSGTSVTPATAPGKSVHYSLRTAVANSVWAPEVTISYPTASPPPPPTPPPSSEPPESRPVSTGPFEFGAVSGAAVTELPYLQQLGVHTARVEFGINTPASQIAPLVEAFAKAGIRPLLLAGFSGRIPSTAEAQNLAGWAAAFGPGGTLWQGRSFPANTAVTSIEFGNETSYTYQFSDNSPSGYTARAQAYALRFKDAQEAIGAANGNVGLLAQGDSGGNTSAWVDNMFAAVPDLARRVAGWTVHPYGTGWQARMDQLVANTAAHGAPSTIPIVITEWGLASDNGHCLSDNYGWNKCMSYSEAATTLGSVLGALRARYGSRLAAFYLYHARDQSVTGTSTNREAYFGALQSNRATKGPYTTEVQSLAAENP